MTRTVLITGASSGIGLATAEMFFAQGWNVAATMRTPRPVRQDARWLTAALDVTDADSISAALRSAIDRFARVDVLVNNAGYGLSGTFESIEESRIARQFDTNVFGLMRTCRAILPHFRANGGGVIINVASMGGRLGFPFYSVYNASKWAVEGFSESLQFEVEPLNVRVKIIEPGAIKTDFYERSADFSHDRSLTVYNEVVDKVVARMNRIGAKGTGPDQVAETIMKAAEDTSSRMRYPIGKDAKMLLRVRRLLGDRATYNALKKSLLK